MWTPNIYTPQGILSRATIPAATASPLYTWTTHNQPWTSDPNANRHMEPQHLWQNSPLVQSPAVGWVQPGVNPYFLQNIPQRPSSGYDFDSSSLRTRNRFAPSQPQWRHSHDFNRCLQFSSSRNNGLRMQVNDGSLAIGQLRWDIRQHPASARSGVSARSSIPNLDVPALPLGVVSAEIGFGNRRMKHFNDNWGAIRIQKRSEVTSGISNPISIGDILEEIYRYFMMPLDDQERALLVSTPRRKEEVLAAFGADRSEAQALNYDFYRRADLLPDGLLNFDEIEFIGSGTNSCFLRLRLR